MLEIEKSDEEDTLQVEDSDDTYSILDIADIDSDESEYSNSFYERHKRSNLECDKNEDSDGPSTSKRPKQISKRLLSDEISDWDKDDEMILLDAFKDYGTGHLKALSERLPNKTPNEIKEYIMRKRKGARINMKEGMPNKNEAAIEKWITELCNLSPNEDYKLQYVARALKYIALFEERQPENEDVENVNLKDCYLFLSSLLSGVGAKYCNKVTSYYMHSVMQKFAAYMKNRDNVEESKYLKRTSKVSTKCYGKKKTTDEEMNPLKLPKEVLKLD